MTGLVVLRSVMIAIANWTPEMPTPTAPVAAGSNAPAAVIGEPVPANRFPFETPISSSETSTVLVEPAGVT